MAGTLISKSDAKKLMEELFSMADPTQHRFKPAFLKHADASCKIAGETATDIINRHPELKIDSGMVAVAAYLHDIGRLLTVDQRFHEIRGALYTRDMGCEAGIAADKHDLESLSEMIISHFIVYEEFVEGDYIMRKEFPAITPQHLLPKTIEQQIIVYSDLSNMEGKEMNFMERLSYIENVLENGLKSNQQFLRAFEKGRPRIVGICRGIEELRGV